MDAISTARQFVLEHPWAVVAFVILVVVLLRGMAYRARLRAKARPAYEGPPRDGSDVRDSRPTVLKARRQMIMALIAAVVVAILVIIQNLN